MRGFAACHGYIIGKAFLINRKSDIYKKEIPKDAILIAKEADPDLFIHFDKIKGIVTDQGGITCHVASLTREFCIPCVVGTKNATQVIRDGDLIELDASNAIVKILNTNN